MHGCVHFFWKKFGVLKEKEVKQSCVVLYDTGQAADTHGVGLCVAPCAHNDMWVKG